MNRRTQAAAIAAVIAIGAAAGIAIWRSGPQAAAQEEHAHGESGAHGHGGGRGDGQGDGHADAPAAVLLDDTQLREAGIGLATAAPARLAERVLLSGEIRYDADRTVQLTARAAGIVESVHVQPGERVRRGQLLAWLSSPALADLRAQALAARQRLAAARATQAREQQLWDERISARQDLEQARSALQEAEIAERGARQKLAGLGAADDAGKSGGTLTRLPLRASSDGTVTERRAAPGQAVAEGEVLFVVSDLARVWAEAPVPARDLAAVSPGRPVRVQAEGGEPQADATVGHVSATLDVHSRSATVRVPLANPHGAWRPGLPVQLAVAASEAEVPVAVPAQALHTLDGRTVVFVREGPTLAVRAVQAGRRDGALQEIAAGLRAGERVAGANSHIVKAELGKAAAAHEH